MVSEYCIRFQTICLNIVPLVSKKCIKRLTEADRADPGLESPALSKETLKLVFRLSDEVVDDLEGDMTGPFVVVEDEAIEAMEHIELFLDPMEGEGVAGGVA